MASTISQTVVIAHVSRLDLSSAQEWDPPNNRSFLRYGYRHWYLDLPERECRLGSYCF